jgi:hypothetical protein
VASGKWRVAHDESIVASGKWLFHLPLATCHWPLFFEPLLLDFFDVL